MRKIFRWSFFLAAVCFSSLLVLPKAEAGPLQLNTSTQFLWGDDLLGESQAIIAQYLRFTYKPEGRNYSLTGYGRLWQDLGTPVVRSDDFEGRLYYLYLDYKPLDNLALRLGRQYVNFSAGSSIMDGVAVNVDNLGPIGVTVAGGRDVVYSLDSEYSSSNNYIIGLDVHLQGIRTLQAGVSYVRRYVEGYLAREEFGFNFRYYYKWLSPYAEIRYDRLSETFNEQTAGLDIFPLGNLMIKGEYYQSYPTFDATSIYSVFAVDRYREYLVRAEYSGLPIPVTVFASYTSQVYQEGADASVYSVGARAYPIDNLTVNAAYNYRDGYSGFDGITGDSKGRLSGFEFYGNYRFMKVLTVFAGVQYDTYNRPEINGNNYATRYWGGGQWIANENVSVSARIENNVNENFDHRTLGRVTLDWKL
ncbi:MAG: hypothetical protein P8013_13890 [Candidatus Sulfobium sp.]|jgi:hypothetical protein